ncbi:hypothetical protein N9W89_00345 [Hellea sp.]|nr:hypothetical protein [Hellea sp.]
MSFSFTWDVLSFFEILGIVLAVIGFFNLSEKLEHGFGAIENSLKTYSHYKADHARSFWPPHKNIKSLSVEAVQTFPILLVLYLFTVWVMGWGEILWTGFLGLSTMLKTIVIVSIFIGLILNEILSTYIIARIFGYIALGFNRLFSLLAKPPSGITGTLGLLITLLCFGLSHISQS